ncbi:hypothetical protein TSUD_250370 [Trifolium subterraneum]|nr:hypothetical protein TSUD_250370 [Trifolium subterraneum]
MERDDGWREADEKRYGCRQLDGEIRREKDGEIRMERVGWRETDGERRMEGEG